MTVAPGRTRHRTEHQYRESPVRPDRGDRCADLTAALDRLSGARVLVVGDVMLDRFVLGVVERISPEAPAPILRVDREWARPGGAGNLARNLAALGARCRLLSVVGADDAARQVRDLLDDDPNIDCRLIAAGGRRTSVKERHVAQGRLLLRADRETAEAVSPGLAQSLMDAARAGIRDADAVVLSDYAKGVLSAPVIRHVISDARRAGKPVVVDPKGLDFGRYRGADLVTPNRGELAAATGLSTADDGAIAAAGRRLIERAGIAQVLATRSEDGMTLVRGDGTVRHFRARARRVFDVAGAGDTVAAVMGAGLAAGLGADVATLLANAAAGVVVGKPGTAVATLDEIREAIQSSASGDHCAKIVDRRQLALHAARWRQAGLRVGFTNGCFDLLHPGHLALLTHARAACDRLVVAVNGDSSVRALKGRGRPVRDAADRAAVLVALRDVDLVAVFSEPTPIALIRMVRPDVLVKGADHPRETIVGADFVEACGGQVIRVPLEAGHSTSATLEKLAGRGPGPGC